MRIVRCFIERRCAGIWQAQQCRHIQQAKTICNCHDQSLSIRWKGFWVTMDTFSYKQGTVLICDSTSPQAGRFGIQRTVGAHRSTIQGRPALMQSILICCLWAGVRSLMKDPESLVRHLGPG